MSKLLTKKRSKWAQERNVRIIRGKPLTPNAGLKDWYTRELLKMTDAMAAITRKELEGLFTGYESPTFDAESGGCSRMERQGRTQAGFPPEHSHRPQERMQDSWTFDESIASQARITLNRLKERLFATFDNKAKRLAERMLMKQDRFAKTSLAESLREMSGGLSVKTDFYTGPLKESIKAGINYNASLIRSIPERFHQQISGAVQRSILEGKGMADLAPELEKYAGITAKRARFIAKDQTKKTFNTISRHRMIGAGITHFEWLHSGGGQHPRWFHQGRWPNGLNGGIFPLNVAPVTDPKTGHTSYPGEDPGCNCKKRPVLLLGDQEPVA